MVINRGSSPGISPWIRPCTRGQNNVPAMFLQYQDFIAALQKRYITPCLCIFAT